MFQDGAEPDPAAQSPERLRARLERLFEYPPSRERDGEVALVYLALASQTSGAERERAFLAGYSYARTSRHPEARERAERLRGELDAWKR